MVDSQFAANQTGGQLAVILGRAIAPSAFPSRANSGGYAPHRPHVVLRCSRRALAIGRPIGHEPSRVLIPHVAAAASSRPSRSGFPAGPIGGIMRHARSYPPRRLRLPPRALARVLRRRPGRTIGRRSGVPVTVDQWDWSCGFRPASERVQAERGIAPDFSQARVAFQAAWLRLLPKLTESDFQEYRRERAFRD